MIYHALFVILKKQQNLKLRLLQIIGGALRVITADDSKEIPSLIRSGNSLHAGLFLMLLL